MSLSILAPEGAPIRPTRRRPLVGAHADYRASDYYFARTQSPETRDLPWEHRIKPLRRWDTYAIYAVTLLAAAVMTTMFV